MLLSILLAKENIIPDIFFMILSPLQMFLLFPELNLNHPLKIGQVSWPEWAPSLRTMSLEMSSDMIYSIFHTGSETY